MNRLRLVAVSLCTLLAACGGKSKAPAPPPVTPKGVDAGLDPATAAARAAEEQRRAELVDKCRIAVWGGKNQPGIAVTLCDVAYKEDPRGSVKALLSQAKQMLASLDAEEKHAFDSKKADAALAKGEGIKAYKLLRSCCSSDRARLSKATQAAEKQCTRQLKSPQHDPAACYVWFDSVCEKLPKAEWQPPSGKRYKPSGPLGKTDWRPKDPKIELMLSTQAAAGGAPNLNCQPEPTTAVLANAGRDPKSWFEVWHDSPDARDALNAYYESGTGKGTEGVTSEPALAQSLAKIASLQRDAANAVANHQPAQAIGPLEQALDLDTRVVTCTEDAGFPPPPVLLEGGHRKKLLEQYANATLTAGQEALAKGDTKEACRLFLAGQQKLATPELTQALAGCAH